MSMDLSYHKGELYSKTLIYGSEGFQVIKPFMQERGRVKVKYIYEKTYMIYIYNII